MGKPGLAKHSADGNHDNQEDLAHAHEAQPEIAEMQIEGVQSGGAVLPSPQPAGAHVPVLCGLGNLPLLCLFLSLLLVLRFACCVLFVFCVCCVVYLWDRVGYEGCVVSAVSEGMWRVCALCHLVCVVGCMCCVGVCDVCSMCGRYVENGDGCYHRFFSPDSTTALFHLADAGPERAF